MDRIHTSDVMAVLLPIWNEKRETAKRVRRRISAVMRWTEAQGFREDNPAGDAIGAALPNNGVRLRHHPALPYAEVSGAIGTVRRSGAYPATALAFEFLVLTACRSGEVRGARWKEMDLAGREWRIPGERMKARREHRVPLTRGALAVLQEAQALADGSGVVFPSAGGGPLNGAAIAKLVRDLGIGAVPHGFRSSFRDWAAECMVSRVPAATPFDSGVPAVEDVSPGVIPALGDFVQLQDKTGALRPIPSRSGAPRVPVWRPLRENRPAFQAVRTPAGPV